MINSSLLYAGQQEIVKWCENNDFRVINIQDIDYKALANDLNRLTFHVVVGVTQPGEPVYGSETYYEQSAYMPDYEEEKEFIIDVAIDEDGDAFITNINQ